MDSKECLKSPTLRSVAESSGKVGGTGGGEGGEGERRPGRASGSGSGSGPGFGGGVGVGSSWGRWLCWLTAEAVSGGVCSEL
jgi:hypothetical protein